jgi:tripartite-type tricarboxylate transporter receptor subunit TctC
LRNRTPAWSSAVVIALASVATILVGGVARADACQTNFQGKTLRWIVSGNAGSAYDVASRLIGPHFAGELGAKVVFENLRGGSGLVAMKEITRSGSDGTTVAIAGGAQTLLGSFDGRLPDPARGLTLLGQVEGSRYVWATGTGSELRSMEDLFGIAEERPLLFAIYEPKGASFTRLVAEARLLGVRTEFVTGYRGSAQTAMAAIRGEVDIVEFGVEGKIDLFANGDLRPLMQVTRQGMPGPLFEGLPKLFGDDGLVAQRTRQLERDPAEVAADVSGLEAYLNVGRIIVAPKETKPELVPCMRAALERAFERPALRADHEAAGRILAPQTAAETVHYIDAAREILPRWAPAVEEARAALRR